MGRGVTVKPTGCGFDPHSRIWNIYLNLYFHFFALVARLSAALSSATQHAIPPELGRKWGTECLYTRFPLPTLLCAGYSVKLIQLFLHLLLNKYNQVSNWQFNSKDKWNKLVHLSMYTEQPKKQLHFLPTVGVKSLPIPLYAGYSVKPLFCVKTQPLSTFWAYLKYSHNRG